MRLLVIFAIASFIVFSTEGCKSSSTKAPALLCDTTCIKDTLKFAGDHKLKPVVYLTVNECKGDSLIWSYTGMGANRKTKFDYPTVKLNKNFVRCVFKDTGFAYLLFNDCATRRGFQVKLPYDKKQSFAMRTSGINNIDPKFSLGDNLLAYTDRGNIYVEEIKTGKKAMMTFGEKLDIDYDAIHEYIDSVNITNSRIWVKVKIGDNWKELEKKITLE
jgi:hypothetical protein